ncbi:hypothetical protein EAE96_011300 [Botrytis aclada]|nr:hypothetical protein EAE96_011300 [Botrytis aclada]
MKNLVEPDNRFKVELREPLLDTTGFKKIRVSNVEGDFLDISFRHTLRVPESSNRLKVPPDFGPFPIYPIDDYKDKFDPSIPTKDGVFIPIYQREAMRIHFESDGLFAVKVIIDGVNVVSGESHKESLSADLRRIALLYENKSIQYYVVAGKSGQKWLDGIKIKEEKITQFVAAPVQSQVVAPSIKSSINATDGIRGIKFEIVPQTLGMMQRMPLTVHTLSGRVIHLNIYAGSVVRNLINKIQSITSIPYGEQRIHFAGQELEHHRFLTSYGIVAKRLLEHHAAIQESYGEKRDVMFANAGTNIQQDIEDDPLEAEYWDTENTLIFNLQMINAQASEIVLGSKPPPCPISMAVCKEYKSPLLSIHNDDEEENNDNRDEDEDEDEHKVFSVTTDQSGARGSFAPVENTIVRLSSIFQLPDDDI